MTRARGTGPHFPFANARMGSFSPATREREKFGRASPAFLAHEVGEKGPVAAPFARRWEVRALATLSLCVALIAAPARAESPAKPQRIVSLNVCVDQLLLLMVDKRRIAALTQFATDPDWSNM